MLWLEGSQPTEPALRTPISVGVVPSVVTSPLPLSPLHAEDVAEEAQSAIASYETNPPERSPHVPCRSTVAVIQPSGPLEFVAGDSRPKPAMPTAAPVG